MLWIQDVYPGSRLFWFLPIPDPVSWIPDQQKRGVKKNCCNTFFCGHKFHKIENYFIFEMLKKKKLGQFLKNYTTFYPKNCHKALKNLGLGYGIRKKPIPDPWSRGQKGTGSRIRIRNTGSNKRIFGLSVGGGWCWRGRGEQCKKPDLMVIWAAESQLLLLGRWPAMLQQSALKNIYTKH